MYIDGELKLGYNKSTLHFHAIFTHPYSSFARPKSKCVPIILKCLRTAPTPQLTCNDASCTARCQWITTMKNWTFTTSPKIVYGNRTASPCGAYCITELFELHHFLSRGCIASKPPMHRQLPARGLCRFRTWRELQHNARSLVARREEGLGEASMAKWSRELHISRRSAASWEAANCSAHSTMPKEKHLPDVLCGRLRGRGGWGHWI